MKSPQIIIPCLLATITMVSCFPKKLDGDTVSRDQVGQSQQVRMGTVKSVRKVNIQAGQTAGSTIGTIAGAIAGSQIGDGSGSTLGALGGSAVGAVAGGAVQQKTGNKPGVELIIKLDNESDTVSFVQEENKNETFEVGDRVRVIYGMDRARVTH
jgi:outer membrane lipoprotein SlyB